MYDQQYLSSPTYRVRRLTIRSILWSFVIARLLAAHFKMIVGTVVGGLSEREAEC